MDALYADWNKDLFHDLFVAKIQQPLFYNNHSVSILFVCAAGYYMIARRDYMPTAIYCALATASIHEFSLGAIDSLLGTNSGISWNYAVVLSAFILLAVGLGKTYHRKVLTTLTLIMIIWFGCVALLNYNGFNIGETMSNTIAFGKGANFDNPITNFAEVISWIIPSSVWMLPRRIFE